MTSRHLWAIFVLGWLCLAMAAGAQAAVVGRFTMVQGQVDLLKQGKLPAQGAKVNDGVEPGDFIRTKSKAKAQVRFVDDSFVTLAPESRMAVADFVYDGATGERHAVLRFFKGVIHTLVNRVIKVQQPDFIMETHTAIMGVRGTENYTVLLPSVTGAYLIDGLLEVRSNKPQIPETLVLNGMESTLIPLEQAPRLRKNITPDMLEMLKMLMNTGLSDRALLGAGAGLAGGRNFPEVLGFPGGPEQYMQPSITPQLVPPPVTPPVQQHRGPSPSPGPGISPGITP